MLHPFVHGELLLNGLPMESEFARQLARVNTAPVAPAGEVAAFILWAKLAGTGIGYVDTHLLVSARLIPHGQIMTKDKNLMAQSERFDVAYVPS
jgi:hypothetical protein